MEKALNNRAQLRAMTLEARKLGPEMFKVYKAAIGETLTNQTLMETIQAGTESIPVLSEKVLNKILVRNGDQLKMILGPDHFDKIKVLQKALGRTQGLAGTFAEGALPQSARPKNFTEIETTLSLIRQIKQRVLSVQYVGVNLTVNNIQAYQTKLAQGIWREALSDIRAYQSKMAVEIWQDAIANPKHAAELARAATNKATASAVKSLFTPAFGILGGEPTSETVDISKELKAPNRNPSNREFLEIFK
jgi:hypothetical protein